MPEAKSTIMVVEDDVQFRRFLAEVLDDAGYAVELAGSGSAALEQLDKQEVDLVLTDLVMPGQDGVSLIRALRSRWPALPIVAMSGRARTDMGSDVLAVVRLLGADHTLHKPFTTEDLQAILQKLLTKH